jgi:hypothetical protein
MLMWDMFLMTADQNNEGVIFGIMEFTRVLGFSLPHIQ